MNPNQDSEGLDEIVDETEVDNSSSVDDFIKQLEAKEKDLHITAETTIEVEDSFDDANLPDFIKSGEFEFAAPATVPASIPPMPVETGSKGITLPLEKEIAGLKAQIATLEADRDEMRHATLRRAKDFDNYKSRTERERKETFQTQIGNLATQMLPALDNLNRALDFAMELPEQQRTDMQQFFDGIVLVNQQVNEVFAAMGIQPIETVGHTFDPHLHEAVATEEAGDRDPNTISAELLRGYRMGDRVIRHSMVKVVKDTDSSPTPDEDLSTQSPLLIIDEVEVELVASPPPIISVDES